MCLFLHAATSVRVCDRERSVRTHINQLQEIKQEERTYNLSNTPRHTQRHTHVPGHTEAHVTDLRSVFASVHRRVQSILTTNSTSFLPSVLMHWRDSSAADKCVCGSAGRGFGLRWIWLELGSVGTAGSWAAIFSPCRELLWFPS